MQKNYQNTNQKLHQGVNPNHPALKTRSPKDVFPEDIDCVIEPINGKGGIFIGNLQAAQNPTTLKKLQIGSLLTACKNVHIRHPRDIVPFSLYIPGQDHQNYDLALHFQTANKFIHESRKETNILVHCMAGISRSVTLVLAYLISHQNMTLTSALSLLQKKRPKVNPNPGFIRQLQKHQKTKVISKGNNWMANQRQPQPEYKFKQQYRYHQYSTSQKPIDHFYRSRLSIDNKNIQNSPPYNKYEQRRSIDYKYSKNPQLQTKNNLNLSYYVQPQNKIYQSTVRSRYDALKNTTNNQLDQREKDIELLSKDLDQRIAKIRQKYYDSSVNTSNYRTSTYKNHNESNIQLLRSRIGAQLGQSRQSLRHTIYSFNTKLTPKAEFY